MKCRDYAAALGLEPDEFIELRNLFIETCAADLNQLEAALMNQDSDQVRHAAHSMKGSSGNLGFEELAAIARIMESCASMGNLEGIGDRAAEFREKLALLAGAWEMDA